MLVTGVGGRDGDGDIYRPDNLVTFRDFVLQNTGDLGVHFVMADGVSHTCTNSMCTTCVCNASRFVVWAVDAARTSDHVLLTACCRDVSVGASLIAVHKLQSALLDAA